MLAIGHEKPDIVVAHHAIDDKMLADIWEARRSTLTISLRGNLLMERNKMLDPEFAEPVGLWPYLPHRDLAGCEALALHQWTPCM